MQICFRRVRVKRVTFFFVFLRTHVYSLLVITLLLKATACNLSNLARTSSAQLSLPLLCCAMCHSHCYDSKEQISEIL